MTPTRTTLDDSLATELRSWGVGGGCALVDRDGVAATAGDLDRSMAWASVTKIVSALTVLSVVADGGLGLDDPAGPPGATVQHLLAHASGLSFDEDRVLASPGSRRIYSNVGIDIAVDVAVAVTQSPSAAELVAERVLRPLGMSATALSGSPAHGMVGPVGDLARLAAELLEPSVLPPGVVDRATSLAYPGLAGVLPGFGRQDPNDWGLGVEIRGTKSPHWMPVEATAQAFGHFGQAGSFVWVDRELGLAAVALTGKAFGPWAAEAWPESSSRWIQAWQGSERGS